MLKMCAYTSDSGLVAARFHPLVNNIVVQARNATCQATLPQSRWTLPHASLARQSGRQMQRAHTPTSRTSFVLSSLSLGVTFGFTRVPNHRLVHGWGPCWLSFPRTCLLLRHPFTLRTWVRRSYGIDVCRAAMFVVVDVTVRAMTRWRVQAVVLSQPDNRCCGGGGERSISKAGFQPKHCRPALPGFVQV